MSTRVYWFVVGVYATLGYLAWALGDARTAIGFCCIAAACGIVVKLTGGDL